MMHNRTGAAEVDGTRYLIQLDNYTDSQVFRLQVTDVPEVLYIVTTPRPASVPL